MGVGVVRATDASFADRVLARVAVDEGRRRRQQRLSHLLPLVTILVVAGAWIITLAVGVETVRLVIQILAWLGAVGQLEQHLSAALLGPFAPLPLIVSWLLFLAAILWVRRHQPDPPGAIR